MALYNTEGEFGFLAGSKGGRGLGGFFPSGLAFAPASERFACSSLNFCRAFGKSALARS